MEPQKRNNVFISVKSYKCSLCGRLEGIFRQLCAALVVAHFYCKSIFTNYLGEHNIGVPVRAPIGEYILWKVLQNVIICVFFRIATAN